ncbi:hypothetical protein niasHS_006603 [Heterodera schachtii]|uniref:Uncharacterized protein n=1 Tax=Heterodera schachtii TaxID=97005 RepID=A0ABD2JHR8_HETSC
MAFAVPSLPPAAPFRPFSATSESSPNRWLCSSLPLRRVLFMLTIVHCLFDVALALKCKCTQNSPKVVCENGICEVSSAASACLMLDHPHSGRHYACSTSELKEGECVEKRSRSGANVKVCSCNSSDFCNFKIWPDGKEEQQQQFDDDDEDSDESDDEEKTEEQSLTNGATRRTTTTTYYSNGANLMDAVPDDAVNNNNEDGDDLEAGGSLWWRRLLQVCCMPCATHRKIWALTNFRPNCPLYGANFQNMHDNTNTVNNNKDRGAMERGNDGANFQNMHDNTNTVNNNNDRGAMERGNGARCDGDFPRYCGGGCCRVQVWGSTYIRSTERFPTLILRLEAAPITVLAPKNTKRGGGGRSNEKRGGGRGKATKIWMERQEERQRTSRDRCSSSRTFSSF